MKTTLRKFTAAWPLMMFLLLPTLTRAETAVQAWVQLYNGPGNSVDIPNALAVDGSNNVVVTGVTTNYVYGPNGDYATIQYSSAGVPLWTNLYSGPGNSYDEAFAVAVDGSNNVIVTGVSGRDYATIQYSSAGVPLWTNYYNGPGNSEDSARAVAVDGSNNVIVTGYSWGSGSGPDYATIQYSSDGVPLWTNRYNGPGNGGDRACGVAVDSSNDVIVTGYSTGDGSQGDYATIKYSSAGVPLWTNRYSTPGFRHDQALAVAVDGNNNVIVGGTADTIKYTSAGTPLWKTDADDLLFLGMAVDRSGNVIVTGMSFSGAGGYDFTTMEYVCVPSPVVTGLQLTNGTFQLRVDGVLQPGTLVIEASTNLTSWVPLFTNTTPTNVLFYADPNAGDGPARFYRGFQFP